MRYEEWLELIENSENTSTDITKLEKIQKEPYNANINKLLEPKLIELIKNRTTKSIDKIIKNLGNIFDDINSLDMALVGFKKEINYNLNLLNNNQINIETQKELYNSFKNEIEKVYDILIKEANKIDPTGSYGLTIKNNRINWSE